MLQAVAWRNPRTVLIGAVLLLLTIGMIFSALDQHFANRIYPNIFIQGVPVGALTTDEARRTLETSYHDFLTTPVTLHYRGRTWTPRLDDLGVQIQFDAAVAQALTHGRGNARRLDDLSEVNAIWGNGYEVVLPITIDQAVLQRYILARAAEVEQPPIDAQLTIHLGEVQTSPPAPGTQLLVEETIADLTAALQTLQPQTVDIRTREISPLIQTTHVAEAKAQIETMLEAPMTVVAHGAAWEWSREELGEMIEVTRVADEEGDRFVVGLDRDELRKRLQIIADVSQYGGKYPRVDWADGALNIIQWGEPVMRIDEERSMDLIIEAALGNERVADLPFIEAKPAIGPDNIHDLGLKDLIGIGQSDFRGSESYRVTNIIAGMNLLHGVLVAPGEEFSFNQTVGEIGPANGFVPGYAIVGEKVQLEWGGGICQDSTTMFRAAFWAGLPITERKGHSHYIDWYDAYGYGPYGHGPGIDATIFTGAQDFKFLNDTGHWILIQTFVDTYSALAEIRIYGTDIGRSIGFEGPSIWHTGEGWKVINFTRIINEQNGDVKREPFTTIFEPWK